MAGRSRRGRGRRMGSGWEEWGGYMEAKRQKLSEQFAKNADETISGPISDIFKGVAIYVDGYTKPSSDELKKIMRQHGGKYEHYMMKTRVTHVIATNLPDSKIRKDFKHCKVVKPEWIIECVKAGRLLSYIPFQLYTGQSKNQPGMASYSAFAVARQTSTTSTLARMATMNESSVSFDKDDLFSPEKSEECIGNHANDMEHFPTPKSPTLDASDSDSSDNEFGRLLAESKKTERESTSNEKKIDDTSKDQNSSKNVIKPDDLMSDDEIDIDIVAQILEETKNTNNNSPMENEKAKSKTESTTCNIVSETENKQSPSKRGMALAGEPEFISEFYNNSRLHHLSTWKSEFKSYVNELQKQGTNFIGRQKLKEFLQKKCDTMSDRGIISVANVGKPEKIIMHVDMDCFFVSVGLRKKPDLKGKPIAVTHSRGKGVKSQVPGSDPQYEFEQWKQRKLQKGNQKQSDSQLTDELGDSWNVISKSSDSFHSMSEIASCSYEARQAGVKNGMFMGKAKSLCPDLITIPYDFEGYNEVSRMLYDIVASYTHDIEAVSCDEMLVDCTDLLSDTGAESLDFVTMLRQEIYQKTKCTASAGLGGNILQAKMATRKAKPNGQYQLKPEDVVEFMKEQSVRDIPGVGWSMSHRLQSMSVSTCGDLQDLSLEALQKEFGPKTGQSLYKYCRGQDDRQIKLEQERKSVSAEINYGIRFKNDYDADKFLMELSEEVHTRLKKINMKGKTVTLKLMIRREDAPKETAKFMGHGLCNHISKSSTLPLATDDPKIIAKECLTILRNQHLNVQDLRGVGIQIQRLESAVVGTKTTNGPASSILKFTVAKLDLPKHTETRNNILPSSLSKSSVETALSIKPQPEKKSRENLMKNFLTNSKTTMENLENSGPEKQKEGIDINLLISKTVTKDSTCQSNMSCSRATQNLAEDITRRSNALIVPPLPTLNLETSPTELFNIPEFPSVNIDLSTPIRSKVPATPELTRNRIAVPADYFPSPSQIDPEVLQELPPDIRKQIEAEMIIRKKSKGVPNDNQNLPSSDEPGCSHWTNPPPAYKKTQQEDSVIGLPSMSQIDPDVLPELPPDIRQQIEAEMNTRHKPDTMPLANQHQTISRNLHSGDQPGCSNWTNQPKANTRPVRSSPIVALPSFSQLDESCFNALPLDIQREIKSAYGNQSKGMQINNKSPNAKNDQVNLASPTKDQSPGHGKKNSPVFKVPKQPKGKSGRGRPKKLNFVSKKQPKIKAAVTGKKSTELLPPDLIRISDDPVVVVNEPPSITTNFGNGSCVPQEQGTSSNTIQDSIKVPVNLCGAVTITEVRTLLKEWIQTSNDPEKDDEEIMTSYLTNLVLDRNLEQVDLVVKFLNRHIKRLENAAWISTFDRILDSVQNVVKGLYGSRLKI
ncbi:DNA repair protein REV1-like isoform X1 [Mytilus californianus]|uniref:DNA repair protein REV1-like isoform X1 n=2 Tax=Mytilus californianus TaxID=6549 RepID=UPI0022475DA9|nr:DNA repair protein REV1-like isoform X1 [Mytilus californianus]XP_052102080.1 DNA repair protein REV1-like isoform X1 [Mytilus californianus]